MKSSDVPKEEERIELVLCPPSAFVFLKGGNPRVINIRSVTWDCFLPAVTERNMKWGSDGHKAILSPRGPFIAFKPCFYSSPLLSPALFLPTKASLMHFIPGALTLDGASLEENCAAAKGKAKTVYKTAGRKLKVAISLLVVSEGVDLTESGEIKKKRCFSIENDIWNWIMQAVVLWTNL